MAQLYIAFVDTPGLFAGIIRRVLKQKYIHVALSLDPRLEEAYSIGRRHPSVPLIAGFEKEDKRKILKAFPGADYTFLLMNIPFYQKNHYTCSSYAARLLEEAGICRWGKHFSLVTPKDFFEYREKQKIFEGSLRELVESDRTADAGVPVFHLAQPAYAGAAYRAYRGVPYER